MRSAEREPLLPLWDNNETSASPTRSEETNSTTPTMILVSVPEALHCVLRAIVRCDCAVKWNRQGVAVRGRDIPLGREETFGFYIHIF